MPDGQPDYVVWTDCGVDPSAAQRLASHATLVRAASPDDWSALPDADAAWISSKVDAGVRLMDKAGERLRVIARPGIGVENVDLAEATRRGITVINTPDAPTNATAEHAMALLLAVARKVWTSGARLVSPEVLASPPPILRGIELRGRTLGVIGFGRIGRRLTTIAGAGFGMKVVAFDPYVSAEALASAGAEPATLEALLATSDVVSLNTLVTEQTRGLMNADRLSRMKPGTILINVGRGALIDEAALLAALHSGHLGGAGLDVFDETPDSKHPLSELSRQGRVVMTPHVAALTDESVRAMSDGVVDGLLAAFEGRRPANLVNGEVWGSR